MTLQENNRTILENATFQTFHKTTVLSQNQQKVNVVKKTHKKNKTWIGTFKIKGDLRDIKAK